MQRSIVKLAYLLVALVTFGTCNESDDWDESNLGLSFVYADGSRPEGERNCCCLPEMWFEQVLDHTDKLNNATWQQRYFVNSEYYKKDGPVFLILGGESPANSESLVSSYVVDLAKKFSATCFLLEHRYYGKSLPLTFSKKESKTKIYLNSNQVLMDVVRFINGMRRIHNISSTEKWIIFGSSYAGTLAAWMRVKFPHLVYGSVAQSAPLVAKVDFPDFFYFIHETVKRHSPACLSAISDGFEEFFIILRDSAGREKLKQMFSLCNTVAPKNTALELSELYDWFLSEIFYVTSNRLVSFPETCKMMTNDSYSSLDKLAALDKEIRKRKELTCLPPRREIQDNVAWLYQCCTQFGWFQTTFSEPFKIFAEIIPIQKYLKKCTKLIGLSYLSTLELGIEHTNLVYGGLDIMKEASNIIFIHGNNDPWMSVSLRNSTNPKISVINVNGSGHVPFSYTPIGNNSNEIWKAKQQLEMLMFSWLK